MSDTADWAWELGTQNQWRNVPYVVDVGDGYVVCKLCDTGGMHKRNCQSHFNGRTHANMFHRVRSYEDAVQQQRRNAVVADRVQSIHEMAAKVQRLGSRAWVNKIKVLMFDLVTNQACDDDAVLFGLEYIKLDMLIRQYFKREAFALVELAPWKCCIADGVVFDSVQQAREYVTLDEAFDIRQYLSSARHTRRCETVIPLIMSFLE